MAKVWKVEKCREIQSKLFFWKKNFIEKLLKTESELESKQRDVYESKGDVGDNSSSRFVLSVRVGENDSETLMDIENHHYNGWEP